MGDSWLAAQTLAGHRLRLVGLTVDDAAEFLAAAGAPADAEQVFEHLAYRPPEDVAEARGVIERLLALPAAVPYAQRLVVTGELVGVTCYYDVDPATRSLAIGHTWIGQRHWRTGVNTESKLLLLSRAFDELGAERVVWHTDIRNTRSQAAITRLGATREGVLRHHKLRRDGSWRDTVLFSMLSAEWPAARRRLQGRQA